MANALDVARCVLGIGPEEGATYTDAINKLAPTWVEQLQAMEQEDGGLTPDRLSRLIASIVVSQCDFDLRLFGDWEAV